MANTANKAEVVSGPTPEQIAAWRERDRKDAERKEKEKRYWAASAILLKKAKDAGFKASEEEIDAYLKQSKGKK